MEGAFCILCFAPCDNFSKPIDEEAGKSLVQVVPHLDFETGVEPQLACTCCLTRLKGYEEFKFSFLQAQAHVQSFCTKQNGGLLDVRQVSLQNKCGASTDVVVCRFCLKPTTGTYTALVEDQKELILVTIMMGMCFPGLELGTMSGCTICLPCHEALEASYNFITSLNLQNRIKKDKVTEEMEFEEGSDVKTDLFESEGFTIGNAKVDSKPVKMEDDRVMANGDKFDEGVEAKVKGRFEQIDEQKLEKKYKVEIGAIQTDDGGRNQSIFISIKKENVEEGFGCFGDNAYDVKVEPSASENSTSGPSAAQTADSLETRLEKCEKRIFKCGFCAYECKQRSTFKIHMLVHKSPSEITMYACAICPYKAKVQGNLNKHMVIHKNPSEVTMYKCTSCTFETRRKQSLQHHELSHKNSSEVPMYKCVACSYETKHKRYYNDHILLHKNPSEITMYACTFCPFKVKLRANLNKHMLLHKDPSKLVMHKCKSCTYETKHKRSLVYHELNHKNASELPVYKCNACSYETKRKKNYNRHMLSHKNPSEITMYQCETCSYKSRYKQALRRHVVIHNNPRRSESNNV